MSEWDDANYKPDVTDKQISSLRVRTNRLVVDDAAQSAALSATSVFVRRLKVKAERANQGQVFIGSDVSVDLRNNGWPLDAGEEHSLGVNDLSIVFYQGERVGDAIRIIYES